MSEARAAQVAAQAKINLRLRVLAREENGYHQIETLFLRIALADTVRVRRTPRERSLDVTGDVDLSALGPVEKNLAWRAAESLAAALEWRGGYAIEIVKHIPIGGGLGGGSADAAGVLRVMNTLAEEPMETLRHLAIPLGADVPFLTGESAYSLAWGRGERMLALTPPPVREIALVIPDFAVNTAEAYSWLDASETPARARTIVAKDLDSDSLADWSELPFLAGNVFETVVRARHPAVGEMTQRLEEGGALLAQMSGSGSVVFGVFEDATRRDTVANDLGADGIRVIRSRTCAHVEPILPIE